MVGGFSSFVGFPPGEMPPMPPGGFAGALPAPASFHSFTNPSGAFLYICVAAGTTGDLHTTFNETPGSQTHDGSVVWQNIGPANLPIGGWPGMTPAACYFPTDRGQQSVQHMLCRARAKLRKRARAVEVRFDTRFEAAAQLSCRMNGVINDVRLPGGTAAGKVISYKLEAHGDSGEIIGRVVLGCSIGTNSVGPFLARDAAPRGAPVPPVTDPGWPGYVITAGSGGSPDGYVKRGYQKYYATGSTPGDPHYNPPTYAVGTGAGTNLTISNVSGAYINAGASVVGTGIPAGTTITSQLSGTPGGAGIYMTNNPTTAAAASLTIQNSSPSPNAPGYIPPYNSPAYALDFFQPGQPPNWPTLPPTLPPITCPPMNSYWSSGPSDPAGNEISYTPPQCEPNDDGIVFGAANGNSLILQSLWHGIASTMNPINLAIYNLQLDTIVHDAIRQGIAQSQAAIGGLDTPDQSVKESISIPISPIPDIEAQVQQQVLQKMLQGSGLWYELALRPLTNGPFGNYYVIQTSNLLVPETINLSA
jgi:hypothetical protein